jgi:hypothetical protein
MGGPGAPLSAPESVAKMLKLIDALRPEQSGRYMDLDGRETPW